ncbi:Asp23/Gls24 family envelope stress response protein [Streptomyces sp. SL13]|jgi:uncharacterized alkaline shock family protein YloU|uniref:Asp23/Gls24 family envelope stress response protein n=1 Tax=Streptantibioticus silvisoli TaxID=2705255 RepID=A0AA90KAN9_9ACTN|nr:Asp23/Gls24 family envelope stress response protein [Streptantibioticus silvisoli]MDI5961726.1 Asp23/Gls24 family envelope stress response protein [Streptantibioticus silvisoli]MDI5972342.1 Asp23/Gls24 family envelope stress response protein [Streptantibioticus silvisoli]
MTDTLSRNAKDTRPGGGEQSDRSPQGRSGTDIKAEERGRTSIANDVVEKIAGMATREVPGVYGLGAGMSRALGTMRDRVPGGSRDSSVTRGVKVEVGEKEAAVDLDVVVEYDVDIMRLAGQIRSTVVSEVEGMTGLDVVEVNIAVDDVHLPQEESESDEDADEGGRVR